MNITLSNEQAFDQQLVARARTGDLDAFNEVVDWYQGLVYRVSLRILGDAALAEDATQETFIKAYTSLDQYRGGSFKSWLTRIATNRSYDLIRSERRRPAASLESELVETKPRWSVEPGSEEPDAYATRNQLSAYLERALQLLPDDQRTAIVLYDIHGYSYDEIAEVAETSLGTVKSRISRGRARLRDMLKDDVRSRELFESVWRHSDDGSDT